MTVTNQFYEHIKLKKGQLERGFILCSRLLKYLDDTADFRYLDSNEHRYFWHVKVYHPNEYCYMLIVVLYA